MVFVFGKVIPKTRKLLQNAKNLLSFIPSLTCLDMKIIMNVRTYVGVCEAQNDMKKLNNIIYGV